MKTVKDIDKEYENYCENYAKGSDEITEAYNAIRDSFDTYLSLIEEHEWKKGFNHAMRLMLGGGAK